MGAGRKFTKLIRNLYSGCTTSFLSNGEYSEPAALNCGVRQGCPLSGLLFNVAFDPILRSVYAAGDGVSVLAFADDVLVFGNSADELQSNLNKIVHTSELLRLKFNPAK